MLKTSKTFRYQCEFWNFHFKSAYSTVQTYAWLMFVVRNFATLKEQCIFLFNFFHRTLLSCTYLPGPSDGWDGVAGRFALQRHCRSLLYLHFSLRRHVVYTRRHCHWKTLFVKITRKRMKILWDTVCKFICYVTRNFNSPIQENNVILKV